MFINFFVLFKSSVSANNWTNDYWDTLYKVDPIWSQNWCQGYVLMGRGHQEFYSVLSLVGNLY